MITEWLTPDNIQIVDTVDNWQTAVKLSAAPLLNKNFISQDYIDAIIASHLELGPYYVLAPGIAMPHARPEQGAFKNGLALLHIQSGVSFNADENDPIYVVITLCAQSGDEHLRLIQALAEIFSDEQRLEQLIQASDYDAITQVLTKE